MKQTDAQRAAAEKRQELAILYARVAADPAGRQVLSDIVNSLSSPEAQVRTGERVDAAGFMARSAEARRITVMINDGKRGPMQ